MTVKQKEVSDKKKTLAVNGSGRPRVKIAQKGVLDAWERYRSINRAARELGISPGVCFNRLKKLGICPLGMTRSERGRFGYMVKAEIFKPVSIRKVHSTPFA